MKKVLLACLLAGTGHLFAQTVDLKDLQQVLYAHANEANDQLLAGKGFTSGLNTVQVLTKPGQLSFGKTWYFRSEASADGNILAQIRKSSDTTHPAVQYETSNAWFYTSIMNQLAQYGFKYSNTMVDNNEPVLCFSNDKEELHVAAAGSTVNRYFKLVLQPLPNRSNVRTRMMQ